MIGLVKVFPTYIVFSDEFKLYVKSLKITSLLMLMDIFLFFHHVCLSEGVANWRADTQAVHPPQSRMEESSHTYSCGADGE